ncbi:hypothetical protein RRG08_034147 [Elysia crispata]|uniref:Uncharacterized protein n=1 Tax=Elysia crispata TaxID=231223 RepID=A0AAE0ZLT3_9GAST|nr:hypothetical protein RRG08_034147 [Elysia crispata]
MLATCAHPRIFVHTKGVTSTADVSVAFCGRYVVNTCTRSRVPDGYSEILSRKIEEALSVAAGGHVAFPLGSLELRSLVDCFPFDLHHVLQHVALR